MEDQCSYSLDDDNSSIYIVHLFNSSFHGPLSSLYLDHWYVKLIVNRWHIRNDINVMVNFKPGE